MSVSCFWHIHRHADVYMLKLRPHHIYSNLQTCISVLSTCILHGRILTTCTSLYTQHGKFKNVLKFSFKWQQTLGHISTSNTANCCYNPFPTLHAWDPTCSTRINPTAQHTKWYSVSVHPWVQLWRGLALDGANKTAEKRSDLPGSCSAAYAAVPATVELCILDLCHDMEMKSCDLGALMGKKCQFNHNLDSPH